MEFSHIPVMLDETVFSLDIKENGIYVDGTVGGAGHSTEIAKRLKGGRLYAFDRDPDAVKVASERLKGYNAIVINANFFDLKSELNNININKVDGILLDLGVSSYQLDNKDRGFSYKSDAPLDMRMSKEGATAADLVNNLSREELSRIFKEYGEEQFSYKIAGAIVKERDISPITTTMRLADIIVSAVPSYRRRDGHPARKCFQALRIEVNHELDGLTDAINNAFDMLAVGGVLSIITFHSLEDRIVKKAFKEFCTGCICPPDIPVCVCGRTPRGELVTRKPVLPSEEEISNNKRSRSAKLRSVKKIKE